MFVFMLFDADADANWICYVDMGRGWIRCRLRLTFVVCLFLWVCTGASCTCTDMKVWDEEDENGDS